MYCLNKVNLLYWDIIKANALFTMFFSTIVVLIMIVLIQWILSDEEDEKNNSRRRNVENIDEEQKP